MSLKFKHRFQPLTLVKNRTWVVHGTTYILSVGGRDDFWGWPLHYQILIVDWGRPAKVVNLIYSHEDRQWFNESDFAPRAALSPKRVRDFFRKITGRE